MGLLLVPATRQNLAKSIEKRVDIGLAKRYLQDGFVENLLRISGSEGIRCWAMTRNLLTLFDKIEKGDEVLFSEKSTGKFTHYGIVIAKIQNEDFGNALWPYVGENPWENIYFLANILQVEIDKKELVTKLGYATNYTVPGPVRKDDLSYKSVVEDYQIPVFPHVSESIPDHDFTGRDIETLSKRRQGHAKFAADVKKHYDHQCAVCGISESEFLIAGHILPWSEDQENRLNPSNGICLCPNHDKAFEYGYIGIDDEYKIIINSRIDRESILFSDLSRYDGKKINLPFESLPDKDFLKQHRKKHQLE